MWGNSGRPAQDRVETTGTAAGVKPRQAVAARDVRYRQRLDGRHRGLADQDRSRCSRTDHYGATTASTDRRVSVPGSAADLRYTSPAWSGPSGAPADLMVSPVTGAEEPARVDQIHEEVVDGVKQSQQVPGGWRHRRSGAPASSNEPGPGRDAGSQPSLSRTGAGLWRLPLNAATWSRATSTKGRGGRPRAPRRGSW